MSKAIPIFRDRKDIYLICNDKSDVDALPFNIKHSFTLPRNAWKTPPETLLKKIKKMISKDKLKGVLFLVCAGPSAALYIKELCAFEPSNTYIDLGSILDTFFFKVAIV